MRLELAEFSGLLDRLLHQVQATVSTPVLLTGVWVDYPAHCSADRNELMQPFNDAVRSAAADHGVRLVDVAARMEKETEKGHWDLRIRNGAIDSRQDATRSMETEWWDNMHLNEAGSRLVAHLVMQSIRTNARVAH